MVLIEEICAGLGTCVIVFHPNLFIDILTLFLDSQQSLFDLVVVSHWAGSIELQSLVLGLLVVAFKILQGAGQDYLGIESAFELFSGLGEGFEVFVTADVGPGWLYIWHCTRVESLDILTSKISKNSSSDSFSMNRLDWHFEKYSLAQRL